jgi:hypothetical protein
MCMSGVAVVVGVIVRVIMGVVVGVGVIVSVRMYRVDVRLEGRVVVLLVR